MSELEAIRREAEQRKITRLAHFTPLRNLVHIATTDDGLLSTKQLQKADRLAFNQQDLARLDGQPDHISCSIQYPNAYYLRGKRREARGEARIFFDWACLFIAPHHLWSDTTLLCAHNAAGVRGANVGGGHASFQAMFAAEVVAPQRSWSRGKHPACCPTDAQAEVLVRRQIPLGDLLALAVETQEQAARTHAILAQLQAPIKDLPIIVAPSFYDPTSLAVGLSRGVLPDEKRWRPSSGIAEAP